MYTLFRSSLFATVFLMACFLIPAASAQVGPGGPVDKTTFVNNTMKAMTEQVGLTKEQASKIRPIVEEQFEKQQALRKEARSQEQQDWQARRQEMAKMREAYDKRIMAHLTTEQLPKFKTFRETQQARRSRPNRQQG